MYEPFSEDQLWSVPLKELVTQTLPKVTREHGEDYTDLAKAVLAARVGSDAVEASARAAEQSASAAKLTAGATRNLFWATAALVIVSLIELVVNVTR